ncbi:666_t:CDS:2 [Funneliformis geosporum]|uniref:666_t:CDS:1 n=1 Tax=Funneliformis geosporum TaxID=1117311 RepID=A0A9W4SIK0_9GLOM|nr:666_t:CDS:2 [Funneliformis geosporum]
MIDNKQNIDFTMGSFEEFHFCKLVSKWWHDLSEDEKSERERKYQINRDRKQD